ncbi:MAG: hypothetical protein KAU01_01920 [Candidatus Cloacimonetes bacterium]|nr:hypothetical protein [Candidatus Cloacimonadota bacterium]
MNQFFFKINLNKYGELKQQIISENRTFKITAITYGAVLVVMVTFVILLNYSMKTKIENRRSLLRQIKKEIETYQVSGEFLSSKDLQRIAKISTERIFWAKKLVAFSEVTTDKIAITHFSFKNNNLSLYGITKLDKKEKEFNLIDNFITKLKSNKQISIDFPDIQFKKSHRDIEKDVEILRFQIDCIAKKPDKKEGRI